MSLLFFFNDTATTEIYPLSLHDALPILASPACTFRSIPPTRRSRNTRKPCTALTARSARSRFSAPCATTPSTTRASPSRSEEHTSELQSHSDLVCRLLLEKKKHR